MSKTIVPQISDEDAIQLLFKQYKITAKVKSLPSYIDQNYLVSADDGKQFVLRIANYAEKREAIEFENSVLSHLALKVDYCQQVIPTKDGKEIVTIANDGADFLARLVTYIEGIPLAKLKRQSPELLFSLGEKLGQMDEILSSFAEPVIGTEFYWDLANGLNIVEEYRSHVKDTALTEFVDLTIERFRMRTLPHISKLRRSLIHNDANDYNVIVNDGNFDERQEIVGIIDFGDIVYTHTINNLAIAIAYAILEKPNPLDTAAQLIKGYHSKYPLERAELAVLSDLICLRLCVSICMAAYQQNQRPDDPYLKISQEPIRKTIPVIKDMKPHFAELIFRQACDMPIAENHQQVMLAINESEFGPIVTDCQFELIDMSVSSKEFSGDPEYFALPTLSSCKVGVAAYGEAIALYLKEDLRSLKQPGYHKCYHLGVDLYPAKGTAVLSPLEAVVEEVGTGFVLLKHGNETAFYTLYRGIEALVQRGQELQKGQQFAVVHTHLHVQFITAIFTHAAAIQGACYPFEKEVWQKISPDPSAMLNIPLSVKPDQKEEILNKRNQNIGPSLSLGYDDHIVMERGWKQYLFDHEGRRYIDAYNNVPHVGHCHPRVVDAAYQQMRILNTNTRYLQRGLQEYAEALLATMPDNLEVCFFMSTGSEANELALRMSRTFTGQKDLIVLEGAYHGITTTLTNISPYKFDGPAGRGAPDWVHTAPQADLYRGAYKADDPDAANKYASHIEEIISEVKKKGRGISGFIAETCPSVGGQIFFPDGYLRGVYAHVRSAGGICIADEVQTSYGRTGQSFYAFEVQGVKPDIVVLGKPIGNGHPVSVVVTTREIADAFNNGMEFFSTFGGNSVSCAVGKAVLEIVQEERLQQHAQDVGNHLLDGLKQFKGKYNIVGDVRGSGLFLGVELVRDHETLEPAAAEASFIANRMRQEGILLGTDGPLHNVIKIRPPMPFSRQDADQLLAKFSNILEEDFSR